VGTVAAALVYNRQVVAHIGLVGAYALPFLLSNNSGAVVFLFTYISIINSGILAVSVARNWRPIFYTSSAFTWLIFLGWFVDRYSPADHLAVALTFLGIFFTLFFATSLIRSFVRPDEASSEVLVSTILTALIFYGFVFGISIPDTGKGDVTVLFTYLAAFSVVILVASYRFYGRYLVFASYPFTWLIYGSWFVRHYSPENNFDVAATFAAVFFGVFYGTTLIYRMVSDEIGLAEHAGLLLSNSFITYGFGYAILDSREDTQNLLGVYTAANGILHLSVAHVISRARPAAGDIVQVLAILIITFLTITIPVQFDGNYVTMVWAVEGALLFWLARLNQIKLFEYFSYPVMLLATGSLFFDWVSAYALRTPTPSEFNPQVFANGNFITAVVFVAAFAGIFIVNRNETLKPTISDRIVEPFGYLVAALGIFVVYNALRSEIDNYFHLLSVAVRAGESAHTLADAANLNAVWQTIYTMTFFAILNLVNLFRIRSRWLGSAGIAFSALSLFAFVVTSAVLFGDLRSSYMYSLSPHPINIAIRYIG